MENGDVAGRAVDGSAMRSHDVALAASLVALLVAGAIVLTTGTARVRATTENEANAWASAELEVDAVAPSKLLLGATNLFPGQAIAGCATIRYTGSADGIDLRLHGDGSPGGLAPFVVIELEAGTGTTRDCSDFEPLRRIYRGALSTLLREHGSYRSGLAVLTDAASGSAIMLRGTVTISDDNEAQGLTTDFQLVFEARP